MAKKKNNKAVVSDSMIVRSMSWVEDRKKVDKFFWGMLAVGVMLTLLDLFYTKKVYFQAENFFGFYSLYGFVLCTAIVLAVKAIRVILMRSEAYYAAQDVASEDHPEFDLDRKQADV
jgi:uncharacterized membrane protein